MFYRLLLLLWCYMTAYSLLHTGVLLAPGSALTLLASQGAFCLLSCGPNQRWCCLILMQ